MPCSLLPFTLFCRNAEIENAAILANLDEVIRQVGLFTTRTYRGANPKTMKLVEKLQDLEEEAGMEDAFSLLPRGSKSTRRACC